MWVYASAATARARSKDNQLEGASVIPMRRYTASSVLSSETCALGQKIADAGRSPLRLVKRPAWPRYRIHPVSTHPSVLEELVDGSHIRWGLRVLKAVVSACLLDGYSADRLGS